MQLQKSNRFLLIQQFAHKLLELRAVLSQIQPERKSRLNGRLVLWLIREVLLKEELQDGRFANNRLVVLLKLVDHLLEVLEAANLRLTNRVLTNEKVEQLVFHVLRERIEVFNEGLALAHADQAENHLDTAD